MEKNELNVGQEIIQSLEEAVEYKKGNLSEKDGLKKYTYEDQNFNKDQE